MCDQKPVMLPSGRSVATMLFPLLARGPVETDVSSVQAWRNEHPYVVVGLRDRRFTSSYRNACPS